LVEIGFGSVAGAFLLTSIYYGDIACAFFDTFYSPPSVKLLLLSVLPTGDLGDVYFTFSESKLAGDSI
jgi:hypothetical protein